MAFRYGKAVLTLSRAPGCRAHFRRTCCLKASRFWKTFALPVRHSLLRSPTKFVDVIRKARRAAEQMHLDTCLDRNVNELSYGQKRQLEVAVALCADPKILLMDEPAAGTSPDERANLIKLINDLSPDLTIVLVEHDMDVVFAICDVITVLSYGKLLATGRKDEIQSNQQVIEAYLGQHHA